MPFNTPVTYAIPSTAPVRIAGFNDPPFRIISLETNGTVWLSRNSGMSAGQGTPLRPGTSVLWTEKADLFAICDTGTCSIILTTEVEDWQPDPAAIAAAIVNSGVIIIDQPLRVFSGSLSTSASWIDVSRYQSLLVDITCSAVNANGGEFAFVEFSADAIAIKRSYKIEFRDATSSGNQKKWTASVPILGAFCRVRLASTNISAVATLDASNRPAYTINQEIPSGTVVGPEYASFYWDSTAINAAANLVIGLPPWLGEADLDVSINSLAAMGVSYATLERRDPSTGTMKPFRFLGINVTPVAAQYQIQERFAIDGDALQVTINNTTATNWTVVNIRIVPVSGFGALT